MSKQTVPPHIRFYIPSNELIPTNLQLEVGTIRVRYERILLGFRFTVYESDAGKARDVVDEIVKQMLIDHDEPQHGISWRTVSLEEVQNPWVGCHVYEWFYRVRDSY